MKFKLAETIKSLESLELLETELDEASYKDVLKAEFKRLSSMEMSAMDDEDIKMVNYIAKRQKEITKKIDNQSLENEADGSMGDMGQAPSDHNPKLKYKLKKKDEDDVEEGCDKKKKNAGKKWEGEGECPDCGKEPCECLDEVVADKDIKSKKMSKKVAIARGKANCKGNMTPKQVGTAMKPKFRCTPVDKKKSAQAKKTGKKTARTAAGKKGRKAAQKTKDFRSK